MNPCEVAYDGSAMFDDVKWYHGNYIILFHSTQQTSFLTKIFGHKAVLIGFIPVVYWFGLFTVFILQTSQCFLFHSSTWYDFYHTKSLEKILSNVLVAWMHLSFINFHAPWLLFLWIICTLFWLHNHYSF